MEKHTFYFCNCRLGTFTLEVQEKFPVGMKRMRSLQKESGIPEGRYEVYKDGKYLAIDNIKY